MREQPGVLQKKEIMEFLNTNVRKKECKMQPGQKHFTASSRFVLGVDAKEFLSGSEKG